MPSDPNSPTSAGGDPSGGSSEEDLIQRALNQLAGTPKSGKPPSGTPVSNGNGADLGGLSPDIFPGYTLLREIHRGGQGVVYQALQKSTKKKVAIKVLREGPFASSKDRVRFEREVEILGQLNHPNIVAVQDSGALPPDKGGLHYFVMDYISGRSLDAYLAESNLTVQKVIALFAKICDAVNSAHLKGVIHRDLKPSNIRVDSQGEPHVLDFGLAKVAINDLTDGSTPEFVTVTGQFIGSLAWASPEQAEMSAAKIDTRTDVYSLGVMLYSALTGRFPYAVLGNMRDVLENILKVTPARPSSVQRRINDEVETIVLKCLSKERERRYQNAGELARDLRNYLDGKPVEAKRDNWTYVLRKTLARRKPLVVAVLAIAAALVAATIISTTFWRRAEYQRVLAVAAQQQAQTERDAADAARTLAQQEARKAQKVTEFLQSLLTGADPGQLTAAGPGALIELLHQGALRADAELASEPVVRAAVLDAIGQAFAGLSRFDLARPILQKSLALNRTQWGADAARPEVARTLSTLAYCDWMEGKLGPADEGLRAAEVIARAASGADSDLYADVVVVRGRMYSQDPAKAAEAESILKDVIRIRGLSHGGDSVEIAEAMTDLATAYLAQRRFDDALDLLNKARANVALKWGQNNFAMATIKFHLSEALLGRGKADDLTQARALAGEILDTYRGMFAPLNPHHPLVARASRRVGYLSDLLGQGAGARPFYVEALRIREANTAEPWPAGITALDLGRLLRDAGGESLRADARAALSRAVELLDTVPQGAHDDAPRARVALAELELLAGNAPAAESLARGVLDRQPAPPALAMAQARAVLARVLLTRGDAAAALAQAKEAAQAPIPPGPDHAFLQTVLAQAQLAAGDAAAAAITVRVTADEVPGQTAEARRRRREALTIFAKALEARGDAPGAAAARTRLESER